MAVKARPIADDWWFIPQARQWSFGHYMTFYLGSSGRYSQFALAWLTGRLFGSAAVNVVPLLLLTLSVALSAHLLKTVSRLSSTVTAGRAAGLALLVVVSIVATAPSLYDTIGWFAAVVAYLAGVVTALAAVTCVVGGLKHGGRPWVRALMIAILAAIAGGFDELVGAVLALSGPLAWLTAGALRPQADRRRYGFAIGAMTLGAVVGTAANVFGPGSENRASSQSAHVSISAAAHTAITNLSFLRADAHDGVLLLAIATGVVLWQHFGTVREWRWPAAWAAFLIFVPWLVTAALTAWAGSTESGGHSPFRAAFLPLGSVAAALMLIVWLLLSRFPTLLSQIRATLLALVLVFAGMIGLARDASPIIRAESLRAQVLDARATSVKLQLASDRRTINVHPAPLLTVFTQAYDLSFESTEAQRSGWVAAFRQQYGIPARVGVDVIARQPRAYCLPGVDASWVGVRSCQELRAGG